MGISIHFNGRLKSKSSLPLLVEEVCDIVRIHKWDYHTFEKEFPKNAFGQKEFNRHLYGICFTPPGCETIDLCFLSNGKLTSVSALGYFLKTKDKTIFKGVSVKTQFAGSSVHKLLIHLMDHLSKKYFKNFRLYDEGRYWETRDEKILDKNFKELEELLNAFGDRLEIVPIDSGESFEKYFERILRSVQASRKKEDRD